MDDSGKNDEDAEAKTPPQTPQARRASASTRLKPVQCPKCKGFAPFDKQDCPCCVRDGEVSLARFQQWIGDHPEDA